MTGGIEVEFLWEPILEVIDQGADAGMRAGAVRVANKAKDLAPERTGALRISIQPTPPTGRLSEGTLEIGVTAAAPYATFVEYGTGVFGPVGHVIEPVNAQALQIPIGGGQFIYRAHVLGMEPQAFMEPALMLTQDSVADELGYAIENALLSYGGS